MPTVKVRPAMDRVCPAAKGLKVTVAVSVPPPFETKMVGNVWEMAVKLGTSALGLVLVKVTAVSDDWPVDHPARVPDVNEPP